jgi:hypothetical protein
MSKAFIFVYPIAEYFEYLHKIHDWHDFDTARSIAKFDKMIDERYRKQGFGIYWLMFSKKKQPFKPDLSRFSNHVTILADDHIIASGIHGFEKAADGNWIYQNPEFVARQLPENLTAVAVGGFHGYDCPGKIAQFYHECGTEAMVDIDLTDFLIAREDLRQEVPVVRTKYDMESIYAVHDDPGFYEDMVAAIERQPWIRQRPM